MLAQRRCSPARLGRLPGSISHKKAHIARTPKIVLPPAPSTPARRGRPPKARAALPGAPAATAAEDAVASSAGIAAVESGMSLQGRRGRKPRQEAADATPALPRTGRSRPAWTMTRCLSRRRSRSVTRRAAATAPRNTGAEHRLSTPNRPPHPWICQARRSLPHAGTRPRTRVTFDWPPIERTAAQDGPNQAMAKLLVVARAEGANSRWTP